MEKEFQPDALATAYAADGMFHIDPVKALVSLERAVAGAHECNISRPQ